MLQWVTQFLAAALSRLLWASKANSAAAKAPRRASGRGSVCSVPRRARRAGANAVIGEQGRSLEKIARTICRRP
jgi:hypothetical protein